MSPLTCSLREGEIVPIPTLPEVVTQLSWQYLGTDLYIRTKYDGTWKGWKRIAFTTDNVVSATKWQTARRFWGQLADGTADVNGATL